MKTKITITFFSLVVFVMTALPGQAQLLKKLGDRLEEKINNRAEQKADAAMDQGLDKAEEGIGQMAKNNAHNDNKSKPPNRVGGTQADCANYYYLANNSEVQITAYDRKDHPAIVITYRISEVKSIPGGLQSKVSSEAKDQKGKSLGGGEGIFKCENGNLSADMHIAMSSVPMEQTGGMEVKATQAYLVYPGNMAVGQTLPDGAFHMDMYRKGKLFGQADISIGDRKVEGEEQITTPAGTWKCFRIDYTTTMKMKMGITIPMHYQVKEWFAPGFGVVKTVNYTKKGKMAGHAELTRIKK